jgi:hypothetical protein
MFQIRRRNLNARVQVGFVDRWSVDASWMNDLAFFSRSNLRILC